MLDVGWSEMLVIAIIMIVVVGPKDLPQMLRTFGRMMAKMRGMANDFQKQFNEALKEAELEDVKKSVDSLRSLNPTAEIRKQLNPFEKAAAEVRSGLDGMMKPKPAEAPDKPESAAEPEPEAKPEPPAFPAMTDASVPAPAAASAAAKPVKPVKHAKAEKRAKAAPVAAATPVAAEAAARPKPAKKPATAKKPAAAKAARSTGKPARASK